MMSVENQLMLTIFIIFCFAALVQLFYWLVFYLSPSLYRRSESDIVEEPVSVIICARNEAENLSKFLPSVLGQKYSSFEVIVVNDCSEDSSDEILRILLQKYPNLKVSPIIKDPKFTHHKKFAQFIGIKAASNELLLFTDADCEPESDMWLSNIVSNFDNKTDLVLGYGGYKYEKGFLNRYIRFDSMFIAMQYIGMALRGIPYMGVGRNLAYRRSFFFKNKGFGTHNHIISGDDDLFVNLNATKANTRVEFRTGSHTRSVASSNTTEYIKQKQRHFTTPGYYKAWHKILLIIEPFTRLLFYILFAVIVSALYLWPYAIGVFGLRLIVQLVVLILAQKRFNEKDLIIFSLFFDIFSPAINSTLYFSSLRNRTGRTTWK